MPVSRPPLLLHATIPSLPENKIGALYYATPQKETDLNLSYDFNSFRNERVFLITCFERAIAFSIHHLLDLLPDRSARAIVLYRVRGAKFLRVLIFAILAHGFL